VRPYNRGRWGLGRATVCPATGFHNPYNPVNDDVVFDALGLTTGEREAVYEAVVELVQARLKKA